MGDFRSFDRGSDRDSRPSRGGFGGGRSFGGGDDRRSGGGRSFGGSRGGFGGGRDRREMPMCDAVCAKCGKNCKVPFKPTGDKPVYCSDCFGNQRGEARPSGVDLASGSGSVTQEQFKQLNSKLDQILDILNSLEMIDDSEDEEEAESEKEEVKAE
jgi:CxxC-x17-CxxC domain-containing protein